MKPEAANALGRMMRTGQVRDCLEAAEAALDADPDDHLARAYRGIAKGALGTAEASIADLTAAAEAASRAGQQAVAAFAWHYLGLALCARGDDAAGFARLERAVEMGKRDGELLTALCQTAYRLGREDAARLWGERALLAKDGEARCPEADRVARARPKAFDPGARRRNLIAYCLFGDDQFYHECAITTARQVRFVYPEFTARFHCAPTIPEKVLGTLAATGAEVRIADEPSPARNAGLMWRLLAFDDPEAQVVLVRDVDSPLLPRERAAVDLWLHSDAPFHVMRDHVLHTEPMLAGLWGGFTGLLPKLGPYIRQYLRDDATRFADQNFLRRIVWPRIRDATLSIDSTYALGNSVDFPAGFPRRAGVHTGCGWGRRQILGTS